MKRIAAVVVAGAGVRLLLLSAFYLTDRGGTQRFHVESATVLFIACVVLYRLVFTAPDRVAVPVASSWSSCWWLVCIAIAAALYWPALSIGFLSDDYVLAARASEWNLGAVNPLFFRPLPLALWAVMLHAGAGPVAFHAINIFLHGTNAFLAGRVVAGWVDSLWSIAVALLVLASPIAPEAVAWCSGVFDVLATSMVLSGVLLARRYTAGVTVTARVLFVIVMLAAVLSKEVAVVGVGLVLLDGWIRDRFSRPLLIDAAVVAAIVVAAGAARLALAAGIPRPPLSRYFLQRALFDAVGGLGMPWHVDVVHRWPWMVVWCLFVVVTLATAFAIRSSSRAGTKSAAAACGWILLPLVPALAVLAIAPDLQGSRYLYLPAVGFSALIAVMADEPRRLGTVAAAMLASLVLCFAVGTRQHLQPWLDAAALRDRLEASAQRLKAAGCQVVTVKDPPDSIRGAYVFRNGLREAFARDLGMKADIDPVAGPCGLALDDRPGRP